MSSLAPMAALVGGQLVMCPHHHKTFTTSLSFPTQGVQLRRPTSASKRRSNGHRCMAFAEVKVLDSSDNGNGNGEGGGGVSNSEKPTTTPNVTSETTSKSSAEALPLLKPSPKPMMPPARPKPVMPANGASASSVSPARPGSFSQSYRPKENVANGTGTGTGAGGVQNLDRILQSAEKLGTSNNNFARRTTTPFQQSPTSTSQQPGFQTRWKKGDSVNPAKPPVSSQPSQPRPPQMNDTPRSTTTTGFQTSWRPQSKSQDVNNSPKSPQQQQLQQQKPIVSKPPEAIPRPQTQQQLTPRPPPQVQQQPITESTTIPGPQPTTENGSGSSPEVSDVSKPQEQTKTDLPASVKPLATGTPQTPQVTPPPKTPVLNSPPLLRPQPVVRQAPLMAAKPVLAPKPPAAPPAAPPSPSKGPRLIDMFRKPLEPGAARPQEIPRTDTLKKQPVLKDVGSGKTEALKSETVKRQPVLRDVGSGPPSSRPGMSKARDDKRKKSETVDGVKRRLVADDENAVDDAEELGVNISGVKKGRKYNKARRRAERAEAAKAAAPVKVEILEVGKQGMSVGDLANKLAMTEAAVVKALFMKGIAVTINQMLDEESVKIVCNEYDVEVIEAGTVKVEEMAKKEKEFIDEEDLDSLEFRPPVVTVMGHVDHGKTSLLDYIRKTKVAAGEAGGITQAIGAYQVEVNVDGEAQRCVFLDTPGHQAFSAMRARGARVTDIAIIVVAADDGTRPQTLEAIAHAKAAKVPIVVAVNKIDKPGANVDRVKEELAKVGVVPPEWGGEEQIVPVSAVTGENIDSLLETVMLVAEMQDLKANPNRTASGTVIEASLDKTRGPVATLLVQNGTLKRGDVVLCGESYGKVRALFDEKGKSVNEARPSTAVQVIGLSSVPVAGDEFAIRESIDEARDIAAEYAERMREARLSSQASEGKVTLASLANAVASGKEIGVESQQLNIILRVDVQGTVEAIREALQVLPQDTVQLRFLLQATGDITSSDIDLAVASGAIVIGFNVRMQPGVADKADDEGVEIRSYKVIYDLVDDMRQAMEGLLKPMQEEIPIGTAEVRATFTSGSGRVAGCMVTEGKLRKGCGVHVMRGKKTVFTGTLSSLKRVKEIAKEVDAGLECGVGMDGFNEWQEGDSIKAFDKVEKKRTLEDASASVAAALAENVRV